MPTDELAITMNHSTLKSKMLGQKSYGGFSASAVAIIIHGFLKKSMHYCWSISASSFNKGQLISDLNFGVFKYPISQPKF